jgi:hypothetical protein
MEKEEGLQDQENTEKDDSQETGTPEKTETIDWEKRYKDLEADHTQKSQRLAELERERQAQIESQKEPQEEETYDDLPYVDRKQVETIVSKAVQAERARSAISYFRRTYPDLVEHENVISGIMRNPKDTKMFKDGVSAEERIDSAVKEFKALTEEAVTKAKEEAEAEAKEREEKNAKAKGLGSTSTTPAKSDEEPSDEEEIKKRKSQQAKRRGFA